MMTEQNLQGQYAGFVTRLIAWLLDRGIIAAVIAITAWLVNYLSGILGLNISQCSSTVGWHGYACWFVVFGLIMFTLAFSPLYMLFFWTLVGATPGKAVAGVRIVRLDGKPMTFRTSFRRYVGYAMSFVGLGAGFLLILIDNKRQGWDDKLAGTCVVYAWPARQNERLIERMTEKLFRGEKRIDQYSQKLRGKSIYGTDPAHDSMQGMKTTPNASSDGSVAKHDQGSSQDAGLVAEEETIPGIR